jgi:hypothetical protein
VMAEEHPTELTLLAYVEDELGAEQRASVASHLAECETCAADVAAVQHGRDAVRAAPLLELPSGARERAIATFPEQETVSRGPARRWLAVVTPIAAALALVGGTATLVLTTGGGDDESGASGEAALTTDDSAGSDAAGAEGGGSTGPGPATDRAVPEARELARDLRQKGFDARVDRGTVVVRTSKKAALERLLADYPRDAVRVRVEDP